MQATEAQADSAGQPLVSWGTSAVWWRTSSRNGQTSRPNDSRSTRGPHTPRCHHPSLLSVPLVHTTSIDSTRFVAMNAFAAPRRRVRLFSAEDVAGHATRDDCWVVHEGRVFDITPFVRDHPGGDDLLLPYAGKDLAGAMADSQIHEHSDSAYAVLGEYFIGRLASADDMAKAKQQQKDTLAHMTASGVDVKALQKYGGVERGNFSGKDKDIVITEDFSPDDTDAAGDFQQHQFLDLTKPLIPQVWFAHFDKSFYLEQVHIPRHVKGSAPLFGPWYLEMFTKTEWFVPACVWLPIAATLAVRSVCQFSLLPVPPSAFNLFTCWPAYVQLISGTTPTAWAVLIYAMANGILLWTLLEYGLHRFLFHIDAILPDRTPFFLLHFLLHGVHHYLPMDGQRLVMPPVLFATLQAPFTKLAHTVLPHAFANGIIAGAFVAYVGYDTTHWALHHSRLPAYVMELKRFHLEHHYKNYELGFGVTSKIWDIVFNTEFSP